MNITSNVTAQLEYMTELKFVGKVAWEKGKSCISQRNIIKLLRNYKVRASKSALG
jgi:hypothetical protein